VDRENEGSRYQAFEKDPNRMLLWHGSRLTNFVGILSQGLRIAPPEAPVTGSVGRRTGETPARAMGAVEGADWMGCTADLRFLFPCSFLCSDQCPSCLFVSIRLLQLHVRKRCVDCDRQMRRS